MPATLEPWLARLYAALRRRRAPLVFLLVSLDEAEQLGAGQLPQRLQRQARRLLRSVSWCKRLEV